MIQDELELFRWQEVMVFRGEKLWEKESEIYNWSRSGVMN